MRCRVFALSSVSGLNSAPASDAAIAISRILFMPSRAMACRSATISVAARIDGELTTRNTWLESP